MPSELLKGLLNRDSEEVKDRMGSIVKDSLTVGAIGFAGYKAFQGSNIVGEVGKLVNGGNREFYRAGENLRKDIASITSVKRTAKEASLNAFRGSFNVDAIMGGTEVGDKRAFFATLFDVAKTETSMSDDLKAIIKQGYEASSDLTDEQKARVTALYQSIQSDEKTLDNFRRRYSIYSKAKGMLSASAETLDMPAGQVLRESYANINDTALKNTLQKAKAESNDVIGRYQRLVNMAGKGGKVELVGFQETEDKNVRSLYAKVSFGGDRSLNVPLYLAKDRNGNIVYRATENLSTRYVAPLKVLNAQELFNSVDLSSVKGGNLSQSKASYNFEEYLFERISKTFGNHNGQLSNISKRDILEFYEFQRSFGVDAPRGMFGGISEIKNANGKRFVSHAFAESMAYARSAQSSRFLIGGLESFDPKLHGDIAKRLMQFFPDEVLGEGYPIIARIQDPFSRGQELSFTDIKDRAGRTALNAMARYGRIDEAIQEQTARGYQMVGRYEMASGVKGLANNFTFGVNKNISLFGAAESGSLLGISDAAKGVHGVNLASIMLSGKNATSLGLGEGISYFGGTLRVNSSITDTVHDTGIGRTKIMEELIKARKDNSKGFLTIGGDGADYSIDDFFKTFGGGSNEVILGFKDQETSKIVRRKGMESFTLGISETSVESGRTRYHITGEASQYLDKSKMFSAIIKDTTLGITKAEIKKKLKDAGLDDALADRFFTGLNVDIRQTLFQGSDQVKKSPQYLSSQIAGSLKLFGYDNYADVMQGKIENDTKYLAILNEGRATSYASLDAVPVKERKAGYVKASIRSAIEIIQGGSDVAGFTKAEKIGRVLGVAEEHSARFGVTNFEEIVRSALGSETDDYKTNVMAEIKKGITFTAHYVSSGGLHTDYGRNLAKVEPRFMNYLYASLRGNFGLDEEQATKFIGQFLTRQEGIEGRSNAILGMKLTSFGLTKMGDAKFASQVGTLSGVEKLDLPTMREILDAGGDESEVKSILSRREGNILNLEELISDKKRLEVLKEELGGKTEIFLPGQSTFESLRGYTVSKSGENINIESEFSRYITDLTQSIAGLSEAKTDKEFMNNFYGFKVATGSIAKIAGFSLRNSLTGRISGSGTYMGSGIIFGKDPKAEMKGATALSQERLSGLYEALEKNKGYVLFQDSQGFLDSMTTYKQAITDQLTLDKFADGDITQIEKEAEKRTGQRMQDFFFGMYGGSRSGVGVTAQRNPNIYLAHFMPGIEMVRYDFDEAAEDPVMKLFSRGKQRVTDQAKKNARLAKLNKAMPGLTVASWDDFETARNNHWERYKAAVEEKRRLFGQIGYYSEYEKRTAPGRLRLDRITGAITKEAGKEMFLPKAGAILQFADDADSTIRAFAEMYREAEVRRYNLRDQIKVQESLVIKARNAAFGALEVGSDGKVVMEEVRSYTTAEKINKEIKTIDDKINASTDDQEKAKLESQKKRLEDRINNLQTDATTKKTYYTYNRAKRQVTNDLATARQTLEDANKRIATLKTDIAASKARRSTVRASAIVRRNIVNNALGYMATTEQGVNKIIAAARGTGDTTFEAQVRVMLSLQASTEGDYIKNKEGTIIRDAQGSPLVKRNRSRIQGKALSEGGFALHRFIDPTVDSIHAIRRMSIQDSMQYIDKVGKYVGENLPFDQYMKLEGEDKSNFIRTRYYNRDIEVDALFNEKKLSTDIDKKRKEVTGRLNRYYEVGDLDAAYKKIQKEWYKRNKTYISVDQIKAQALNLSDLDERDLTDKQKLELQKASDAMRVLHELEDNQKRIQTLKRLRKSSFENIDRLAGLTAGFDFNEERQVVDTPSSLRITSPMPPSGAVKSTLTSKTGGYRTSITQGMVARYFENIMNIEVNQRLLSDSEYIKTKSIIEQAQAILDEVKVRGNLIHSQPTNERLQHLHDYLESLISDSKGKTFSLLSEEKVIGNVGSGQSKMTRIAILEQASATLRNSLDSRNASAASAIADTVKATLQDLVDEKGMIRIGVDEGITMLETSTNRTTFFTSMQSYFGLGSSQAEADLRTKHNITSFNDILKNQAYQKEARANFFKSQLTAAGTQAYRSPLDLFLHQASMDKFRPLFSLEKREIKYTDKGGTEQTRSLLLYEDEIAEFDDNQRRYTELEQSFQAQREAREEIKRIEAEQKVKFATEASTAETELTRLRGELTVLDEKINADPTTRDAYLDLVEQKNQQAKVVQELETEMKAKGYNISTKLTKDAFDALRIDPANLEGSNALLPELEKLNGNKPITTMSEFQEAYEKHKGSTITVGDTNMTVEDATRQAFSRALGRHTRTGDVGGGILYFPQFDVEMDMVRGGTKVGSFASRMDFSRFAIGDFDADIYQIYHDTSDVMRTRFQQNAEAFHGLYNTGAEFLIHMKELGKGMEKYGERLGASSMTMKEFRLDQYEKERILKSVGGLDVQIKVGMMGLAHSMTETTDEDLIQEHFKRIRAGASLIAVAQESLIIKAKHLNVAADVGNEFLTALKGSYKEGKGDKLFKFFEENIFKGTIYEGAGMDESITLDNIKFTNLPDDSETAKSLSDAMKSGVKLSKQSLKDTMDLMARTVKEKGYHALGSDSRIYKTLERGDAFNMDQLLKLLSVSMEGGFTGEIPEDRLDEIMNSQRRVRENVAMNIGDLTKGGRGYLATAALGASYLVGVKNSPEVLDAQNKFSDMKAKQSIGGRHLYNMNHREHGNVSPSRFEEPANIYDRPINLGETMVTRSNSMRMYGEAPTYSEAMIGARRVVGAGGNAFLGIQDNRMPISNSYIMKSIKD